MSVVLTINRNMIVLFSFFLSVLAVSQESSSDPVSHSKKTVFLTGGTGVMGFATLKEIAKDLEDIHLKVLARKSDKNEKLLAPYMNNANIEIIWGDFLDYDTVYNGIKGCNYVLHIGGLVSPLADRSPYLTHKINVGSAEVITKAILAQPNADDIKVVYIGSVAETGDRNYPIHWGRIGDPIKVSMFDHYGVSKVLAERVFVESGIKNWVVFRQSGILHSGLVEHMEPIMFDVPLNGVLEWATVEDSARLMNNFVRTDLPQSFFQRYYNIGSGEQYRLTNYEFETLLLGAIGMGPVENLFSPNWFSIKNFHGHFYSDSDVLENYLHFRQNIPVKEYFDYLASQVAFYYRIPKYIPFKKFLGFFVKIFMNQIAKTKTFATLDWVKTKNMKRITAFFGSLEDYEKIPDNWKDFKIDHYNTSSSVSSQFRLDHGFNESKPTSELDIEDMKQAAKFRGGECVSSQMVKGDLMTKLTWKCGHCGKTFEASPNLILLGGHWCPHCYIPEKKWDYDSIAKTNPFFAQVWYPNHKPDEHNVYVFDELFTEPRWNLAK